MFLTKIIQVFYQTALSIAFVNLKPILPGHVLVSPRRVVPRIHDLTPAETSDMFQTVRRVGRMIERVYDASSLNVAVQDGVDAGQSVPHVHAHVIPRQRHDLATTDTVYELLDGDEGDLRRAFGILTENGTQERRRSRFPAVDDGERTPRGAEEMEEEAERLAREMEAEPVD